MNKPLTAASLLFGVMATAGVLFSAAQLRSARETIAVLEKRIDRLESAGASAPTPAALPAAGGTDAPHGPPPTLEELAAEVRKLKDTIASAESEPVARTNGSPGEEVAPDSKPVASQDDEVRRIVEETLVAREKAKAEEDRKRAEEWQKARLQRTIDEMATKLELSAQQKSQVAEILTKFSTAQQDLWTNRKEGENPWQKMQEMRKETDTQVKQFLTAEQASKYDEIMRQMWGPQRMQGGDGGAGTFQPGGGPAPR